MEAVVDEKETRAYYSIHTDTNEVITRLCNRLVILKVLHLPQTRTHPSKGLTR